MIAFLADENLKLQIIRGILRQNLAIDILRIQDAGWQGIADTTVLAWVASPMRAAAL